MKKTKTGGIHFETEAEIRNYLKYEMSPEAIKERAKNKKRKINYDDPRLKHDVLLKGLKLLTNTRYAKGKQLLHTMIKTALEREKLVQMALAEKEPSMKAYFKNQASGLTREHVFLWFVKDWKVTLTHLHELEKQTVEAILDKLSVLHIPMTFGEIEGQGGF